MTSQIPGAAAGPLAYSSLSGPALEYGNHRLFLAFHQDNEIIVLSSQNGSAFDTATEIPNLGSSTYVAPMLAYRSGKLYLISTDYRQYVNLWVSVNDGVTFTGPTLLPVSSKGHPALLTFENEDTKVPELQLLWSDTANFNDQYRMKIASVVDGDFSRLVRPHRFEADQAKFSISATRFQGAWWLAWLGTRHQPPERRAL